MRNSNLLDGSSIELNLFHGGGGESAIRIGKKKKKKNQSKHEKYKVEGDIYRRNAAGMIGIIGRRSEKRENCKEEKQTTANGQNEWD